MRPLQLTSKLGAGTSRYQASCVRPWRSPRHCRVITRAAGRGGGVLDRPAIGLPDLDVKCAAANLFSCELPCARWKLLQCSKPVMIFIVSGRKDTRKQRPRFYRVMLHNDNFNRREYVVQVLLKVIDGLTIDDAVNVMQVQFSLQATALLGAACMHFCWQSRTKGLKSC